MVTEDARPLLRGRRIYLRPPLAHDWRAWAELRAGSRAFLEPWEPTWPADALSRFSYRRRLRLYQRDPTQREKEVLTFIAKGYSVRTAAEALQLSHHTVAGYCKEIYRKLHVSSRAEATSKAITMGLVKAGSE
mgnify:CR=1 FL=1